MKETSNSKYIKLMQHFFLKNIINFFALKASEAFINSVLKWEKVEQ